MGKIKLKMCVNIRKKINEFLERYASDKHTTRLPESLAAFHMHHRCMNLRTETNQSIRCHEVLLLIKCI
jgi:hypothetical protein